VSPTGAMSAPGATWHMVGRSSSSSLLQLPSGITRGSVSLLPAGSTAVAAGEDSSSAAGAGTAAAAALDILMPLRK
jgi:hypothetical protein